MKVICAADDCEFNDNKKCTAKSINLSENYVHTVYDGFQRFNRCNTYKQSEKIAALDELVRKYFEVET